MKAIVLAAVATLAVSTAAFAQSSDKPMDSSKTSPGTVGAMSNASSDGVATDPRQVRKDTGGSDKQSPGTVGAAPDTNAPSSNAGH